MRAFLAGLLVLIIGVCLVVVGAGVGLSDPSIGPGLRQKLGHYPLLRSLYSLHDTGDGAFDYLGKSTDGTDIVLSAYASQWFSDSVLTDFASAVAHVTEKPAHLVSAEDAAAATSHAKLYIFLETKNDDDPETLGKTFNEYGIILYKSALEKFTHDTPRTRDTYVFSTLLHEFGHQIGLPHIETDGCLMNSRAEVAHVAMASPSEVITQFCEGELVRIEKIKAHL